MSEKRRFNVRNVTRKDIGGIYLYQWIGWLITIAMLGAAAYFGIDLPALPGAPVPSGQEISAQGYTNFTGLQVAIPTTFTTATPGVHIDSVGQGAALLVDVNGTPAMIVDESGDVTLSGTCSGCSVASTSGIRIAQPTTAATATPALAISSLASGAKLFEVADASTPVFNILNGGAWDSTGAGTHSGGQTINNWAQVAAPTAQATGTPAVDISNAGVGAILNVSGSALEYQFDTTALDLQGNYLEADIDTEHLMLPSVVSTAITYTAAAGGTGAVATIADGEIWFVWGVFVNVTTDFDATGDDATLVVGDGADGDGFVVLADAELQIADTEQTGSPAGWQGLVAATMGVYLDGAVSSAPHIYAPSGAAETIDWLVDEGSGETISGGAATIYVVYTRVQ